MDRTESKEKAVALRYDSDRHSAPRVVASGHGEVARKILQHAAEAGVPIQNDPDLVELLAKVPLGNDIPVELYQAIAELLAFVYQLNQSAPVASEVANSRR